MREPAVVEGAALAKVERVVAALPESKYLKNHILKFKINIKHLNFDFFPFQ